MTDQPHSGSHPGSHGNSGAWQPVPGGGDYDPDQTMHVSFAAQLPPEPLPGEDPLSAHGPAGPPPGAPTEADPATTWSIPVIRDDGDGDSGEYSMGAFPSSWDQAPSPAAPTQGFAAGMFGQGAAAAQAARAQGRTAPADTGHETGRDPGHDAGQDGGGDGLPPGAGPQDAYAGAWNSTYGGPQGGDAAPWLPSSAPAADAAWSSVVDDPEHRQSAGPGEQPPRQQEFAYDAFTRPDGYGGRAEDRDPYAPDVHALQDPHALPDPGGLHDPHALNDPHGLDGDGHDASGRDASHGDTYDRDQGDRDAYDRDQGDRDAYDRDQGDRDAYDRGGDGPHAEDSREPGAHVPDADGPDADGPDGDRPDPDGLDPDGLEAAGQEPDGLDAGGRDLDGRELDGRDDPGPDADVREPVAAPVPETRSEHPLASYTLRVNGAERPVTDAWLGESLLYVLRERLGLAGAKDGCEQGECGACSVQVDGRLVASCLVPAATAAGSEVRTVEGLSAEGRPSDVQQALAACGAVQCGFCIPGMAMTVHDLLEGNHRPTDLDVRHALSGNLCRCSGYRGVLDAVRQVVADRGADDTADDPPSRVPHQGGPATPEADQ
ncbi:2Fe-2S iron-sulfur cluster-binding protein [Streptomyces sp. V4-01]|uniref:2Fe-2S iron-sulfur cluster-binding protein n=1 Tax=Actinacidiphila polyblastidii TaxID=3110430 RepID=A0ABU7PA58_9ACTN|nr:2Fe-2S iron-sulfur cluster-binding protein [Streptomyces sp. V4-01]